MIISYSFYHKDSGALHPKRFCTDDATQLRGNTPADHVAIEGAYDHLSQRIDLSSPPELVDAFDEHQRPMGQRAVPRMIDYQPPQPSPDHEWDPGTKRWGLNAATVAKAQKRAAARARIAELVASQHQWIRRHILGDTSALAHLQEIDSQIAKLQEMLG
jgi:hypothetical protein